MIRSDEDWVILPKRPPSLRNLLLRWNLTFYGILPCGRAGDSPCDVWQGWFGGAVTSYTWMSTRPRRRFLAAPPARPARTLQTIATDEFCKRTLRTNARDETIDKSDRRRLRTKAADRPAK